MIERELPQPRPVPYRETLSEGRRGTGTSQFAPISVRLEPDAGPGAAGRGLAAVHGDIADRPTWPKVKSGARDCEVATVLGAGHEGVIASAGHRMSEQMVLRALANETKAMVRDTLVSMLGSVGELVPMVTADNDKAFPGRLEFGKAPDTDIYSCFADPCDSCGRVRNECANGLDRQSLGKGASLSDIEPEQVRRPPIRLTALAY